MQGIRQIVSKRCLMIAIVMASATNVSSAAFAALKESESTYREFRSEVILPEKQPQVLVVRQDLAEFLVTAGQINGYKVNFSSEISGVLENMSLPMNMHALMAKLAKTFNLKWHIGSNRLFVSGAAENIERVLELRDLKPEQLKAAVAQQGIRQSDYQMKPLQNRNAVILVGPASYLDSIGQIAAELNGSVNSNE